VKKILLTSFTTWLPHQLSNSSNDLLDEISKLNYISFSLNFIRLLPVDTEIASEAVITKINEIAADIIICCGMAEGRHQLSIESTATKGNKVLKTNVALEKLVDGVDRVNISHDAGKFVCEALYYSVLDYIFEQKLNISCIFVHVPILNENNLVSIGEDFVLILQRISHQS
jgi:pyroglutamyl-peptidase